MLNIQYVYEDEEYAEFVSTENISTQSLSKSSLGILPADLIQRLHEAVLAADYYLILQIIEQVEPYDSQVAAEIRTLTERYDFQRLIDLLS